MSALLVRRWLATGALDVPLPGLGGTPQRWHQLTELAEIDIVSARLAEAHVDAVAILAELGAQPPRPDQLWGVWAAESPDAVLRVRNSGDVMTLEGTKRGARGRRCARTHYVTARMSDDSRGLFAVDLAQSAVRALPNTWRNPGMRDSDTRSVHFATLPPCRLGSPATTFSTRILAWRCRCRGVADLLPIIGTFADPAGQRRNQRHIGGGASLPSSPTTSPKSSACRTTWPSSGG